MKKLFNLPSVAVLMFAGVANAADPRWEAPPITQEGALPKLGAVTLDGDLTEWNAAASVPLRSATHISHCRPPHKWNGPADCSMEVLCGWTREGLCLAAFVADDDVRNNSPETEPYAQDCVELYIDGRTGPSFMKPPYSKGAYQMFLRPPVGGQPVRLSFNSMYGAIDGARAVGKLVRGGWTVEVLLPWSAFPTFNPAAGAAIGLQFGLDDYDKRDAEATQPLFMTWQAATSLFMYPQKMIRWTFVDAIPQGANTPLDLAVTVAIPGEMAGGTTLQGSLELSRSLSAKARFATYEVKDWNGTLVGGGPVSLSNASKPWQTASSGKIAWNAGSVSDGVYKVEATLADAQGAPLGMMRRYVTLSRFLLADARTTAAEGIARIEKANLAAMAQTEPFRAAAWAGAASCVEKVKWAVETQNRLAIQSSCDELRTRLAVLETGALPAGCTGPNTAFALAAQPESQVVIEMGAPRDYWGDLSNTARTYHVVFYWANVPLATVTVKEHPNAGGARSQFEQWNPYEPWQKARVEEFKLANLPARSMQWPLGIVNADMTRFDPARHVLMCSFARGRTYIMDASMVDYASADAAVCYADSGTVKEALTAWAAKTGKPVTDLQQASTNAWCLIAGLPSDTNDLARIRGLKSVRKTVSHLDPGTTTPREFQAPFLDGAVPQQDPGVIVALDGNRVIFPRTVSREAADIAVRLVKAGKPVTAADTDLLRQAVLRAIPKPTATPPAVTNMTLYCGDVHVHTSWSDGISTPVGLALQALYCGMDFVMISDHNCVDGGLLAARLFDEAGVGFSVVPCDEVTTAWGHFNAHPVREHISHELHPSEIVKAAHKQGAVIHWNHPGRSDKIWSEWYPAPGKRALLGTAVDAWEHPIPEYIEWKANGLLPAMVGSTDTHGGIFAHSERTMILAPSTQPDDIADAVRRETTLLVCSGDPRLFLGPDNMIARAVAALTDGQAMRERQAARIKAFFEKADIPALLRKSPAVRPPDSAK